MAKTPIVLDDRAVATILHGLRMIQERANGYGDCMAGCCDHFDEADEMNDAEIDALCEALNLDSVTVATEYTPEARTRIGNTPDDEDDEATIDDVEKGGC